MREVAHAAAPSLWRISIVNKSPCPIATHVPRPKDAILEWSRRQDAIDDEFALQNRNTDRVRLVPSSADCSNSLGAPNHCGARSAPNSAAVRFRGREPSLLQRWPVRALWCEFTNARLPTGRKTRDLVRKNPKDSRLVKLRPRQ